MCLAIPMKIKRIEGRFAVVEAANLTKRINIEMLSAVKTGEYVMVHAGFAIEKVDRIAAEQTLEIIDEIRR
jgi:hydrogenase expression/formation protein HypC